MRVKYVALDIGQFLPPELGRQTADFPELPAAAKKTLLPK
jgi:hypothetical protein